ncbi:MAG: hypothetical protein KDJ22_14410 [Candidatus Competibacteraceae bacterium]|nr:hypothetical protein [Candidatus Competibacteraceae bacterium]
MDIVKYIAWLLPTLLGFAGNWLFKFTEDDPKAPHKKRLTQPGQFAIVAAVASLFLAAYTTYSDQQVAAARAAEAESDLKNLIEKLDHTNARLAKAIGRLNENLMFLGARAGECSIDEVVRFTAKNGDVPVSSASSVLVELATPRIALVWHCGETDKKTRWEEPFDVVRCERTGSGAVVWTFYKKAQTTG